MPARGVTAPAAESGPLDFLFVTKDLELGGRTLKFRELSVKESDACLDTARKPDGTIDGRLNMRLIIAKSSVEPKITVDDISKLPNRVYIKIAEFVNDLNSIDDAEAPADDAEEGSEGNA